MDNQPLLFASSSLSSTNSTRSMMKAIPSKASCSGIGSKLLRKTAHEADLPKRRRFQRRNSKSASMLQAAFQVRSQSCGDLLDDSSDKTNEDEIEHNQRQRIMQLLQCRNSKSSLIIQATMKKVQRRSQSCGSRLVCPDRLQDLSSSSTGVTTKNATWNLSDIVDMRQKALTVLDPQADIQKRWQAIHLQQQNRYYRPAFPAVPSPVPAPSPTHLFKFATATSPKSVMVTTSNCTPQSALSPPSSQRFN